MKNGPHTARKGVLSSAFAGLASMSANILLLPLIIVTVGAGPYGVWLLLIAVATYLHYADLGVGSAIVHFASRARGGGETLSLGNYLSAGLLWNSAIGVLIIPANSVFSTLYVRNSGPDVGISSQDGRILVIAGVVATASFVIRPFASALIGAGLLPIERSCQLAGVVVRILGTVVACLVCGTIEAVAVAETLALLTPPLLAIGVVRRSNLGRISWGRETLSTLRSMMPYSMRAFGVTAVGALLMQGGTFVVASVGGPTDVTNFNAAFSIYSAVRQLLTWLVDPFRSLLSRLFASDRKKAEESLISLARVTLVSAALGCGTLALMSTSAVQIWLGSKVPVDEVALTVAVLLVGLAFNAAHLPLAPAGDAAGRPGVFFRVQLAWLAAFLALGFPLGSKFGIVGVAIALSLPLVVIEPLYLLVAHKTIALDIGEWSRLVLLPTSLGAVGGLVLALFVALAQAGMGNSAISFPTAIAYLGGASLSLFALRKRFPWTGLRELARTNL